MFGKGSLKSGILGIVILLAGVIVGVILVRKTQVFKNKAMEQAGKTYTVCHKQEGEDQVWKEVKVDAEELPKYLNAGDIFGECPKN